MYSIWITVGVITLKPRKTDKSILFLVLHLVAFALRNEHFDGELWVDHHRLCA